MKARTAAVAAMAGLASCLTHASDGNVLLTQCHALIRSIDQQSPDIYEGGRCIGLVEGVTDMLMLYKENLPKKFCVPSSMTYGQGVRIVVKYLQEHPAELNHHDSLLVLLALQDAYPCK